MSIKKSDGATLSGSPGNGEPVYLAVGRLRRPHGVSGEMLMEVYTDFPERLQPAVTIFLGRSHKPLRISGVRNHKDGLLIHFEDFHTPEQAGLYRNQLIYVTASDRPPLPKGQFYHHQLIGFDVVDVANRLLGKLAGILQTGANDVYVVRRADSSELLLPVIPSVVLEVSAEQRLIRVNLIEGLIEAAGT